MTRRYTKYLWTAILVILPVGALRQTAVLDRLAAVVNGEIITLSDIRAEKTIREVLGEVPLKSDRDVLNELIDQRVIQLYLRQYPEINPTKAELDEELSQIKDRKGLTHDQLCDAIRKRLQAQRFFSESFGESLKSSDSELQQIRAETKRWLDHARRMVAIEIFE